MDDAISKPPFTRRPIVLFAAEPTLNSAAVAKNFKDEGFELIFAEDERELAQWVGVPECYLIFMAIEFAKNGLRLMKALKPHSTAYWVFLTAPLTLQYRNALMHLGAVDILTRPVNVGQYKLRAKSFLTRHLKNYRMPDEVVLPPGFSRPKETDYQFERGVMPIEKPDYMQLISGALAEGANDYDLIAGEGETPPAVEVRVHDLSPDAEPAINHLESIDPFMGAKSKGAEAPGDVAESRYLLEMVAKRAVKLKTDVPWNPAKWKKSEIYFPGAFAGLEQTTEGIQSLFRDVCHVLGARRITLISLNPKLQETVCPEIFCALVSSEACPPAPGINEIIETEMMPHLKFLYQNREAYFLSVPLPERIMGRTRPSTWTLNGRNEELSVFIPVRLDAQSSVVLFIQFDSGVTAATQALLEECVTYLTMPARQYGIVDFLNRVYRNIQTGF